MAVHYDDGNARSIGFRDYGFIRDFKIDQDVIRLHGSADMYELGRFRGDTAIFYNADGQASELIGVVNNVTGLDLTSSAFEYATV